VGKQMTRWDLRRWAAALLVLFALRAAPVRADAAAAELLIQQGLKLRREGKPEEALEKFRQAHEMGPSPRTYGQMGLVEATLKRWTDSETHLSVALANPDDAWVHKNRAFLDQALALCRQHVGDLVITGPAGAEVSVGGAPAGTLPAVPALRVAEGTVEVTATAPGSEPFKQSVQIRPGSRTSLKIALTPSPVAASPEGAPQVPAAPEPPAPTHAEPTNPVVPPPPTEQSHWRPWTALALGVAGAGAIAGGVVWLHYDGKCETFHVGGATPGCRAEYDTKILGWAAIGVGAAALIAGGIILFSGPANTDTSVALVASPNELSLVGRF
jgi:hypothetical protein